MKEIGGYFELELRKGDHYHPEALRLNTARNCFEYVLRVKGYKKVYMPYYTCEVMLEPLRKCKVEWEFYHIDECFEPVNAYCLGKDEAFLYTNYWGIKQGCVERLAGIYGHQLIVDCAQAFFAPRVEGIDTFYSARKFLGVPDGAYLYTDKLLDIELERDVSYKRCAHLLKRIDGGAGCGYGDFRTNDDALVNNPIRLMSKLTEAILRNVDYDFVVGRRRENFELLHTCLGEKNRLKLHGLENGEVPMVYPFCAEDEGLRKRLIDNKVFVATYWGNVLEWCCETDMEWQYTRNLLPLPIDQRYEDVDVICRSIF